MDVLVYLAGRAGEVASHAELQDAVWQTEFVAYNTVANRIKELRDALEDDAKHPRYIETIPKRGYRLIAPVRFGEVAGPDAGALVATEQEWPDERSPYPGLPRSPRRTPSDFFGREAEIAALWRKLPEPAPAGADRASGAGKSSFLRAGLVPGRRRAGAASSATPGEAPFAALARALAPDFAGDTEAMQRAARASRTPTSRWPCSARWRGAVGRRRWSWSTSSRSCSRSTGAEVQARFADAAAAAGGSSRTSTSCSRCGTTSCSRCHALRGAAADLRETSRRSGRRPATRCAGRSSSRRDVRLTASRTRRWSTRCSAAVEGERGALPLLAFAAVAAVGAAGPGAAAADAGGLRARSAASPGRWPSTPRRRSSGSGRSGCRSCASCSATSSPRRRPAACATWTSCSRSSPRPARRGARRCSGARRRAAADVLRGRGGRSAGGTTTGSRSCTSPCCERGRGWCAGRPQDEGGAQLRDQLRQAAHLWEEKGRPDDLLWTGTSFQEYQVWRARYPGGLSEVEETFGQRHGRRRRRRRRRRRAVAAAIAVAVVAGRDRGRLLLAPERAGDRGRRARRRSSSPSAGCSSPTTRTPRSPTRSPASSAPTTTRPAASPSRRSGRARRRSSSRTRSSRGPLAWSPDGRWLALGGDRGSCCSWSGDTGERRQLSSSVGRCRWASPRTAGGS